MERFWSCTRYSDALLLPSFRLLIAFFLIFFTRWRMQNLNVWHQNLFHSSLVLALPIARRLFVERVIVVQKFIIEINRPRNVWFNGLALTFLDRFNRSGAQTSLRTVRLNFDQNAHDYVPFSYLQRSLEEWKIWRGRGDENYLKN